MDTENTLSIEFKYGSSYHCVMPTCDKELASSEFRFLSLLLIILSQFYSVRRNNNSVAHNVFFLEYSVSKSASFDTDLDQNFVVFFARPQLRFCISARKNGFLKKEYIFSLCNKTLLPHFQKFLRPCQQPFSTVHITM